MSPPPRVRTLRGAKARRDGRRSEFLCALWLMAKGYRILGVRLKTPRRRSICSPSRRESWP